jgi:hypothetical protein
LIFLFLLGDITNIQFPSIQQHVVYDDDGEEEKEVEEESQLVSLRTLESQRVSEDHCPTGTVVGRTGSRLPPGESRLWVGLPCR